MNKQKELYPRRLNFLYFVEDLDDLKKTFWGNWDKIRKETAELNRKNNDNYCWQHYKGGKGVATPFDKDDVNKRLEMYFNNTPGLSRSTVEMIELILR